MLAGCSGNGADGDLEAMQRALWQATGAVQDERGSTLLHAMESFQHASQRTGMAITSLEPDRRTQVEHRWRGIRSDFRTLLESPKGERVVVEISRGDEASRYIDLLARLSDEALPTLVGSSGAGEPSR